MKVLTIVGPTAVGKTEVSFLLALRHNLEIISADSRQVYQFLDIGTAKPPKEMRERVKFHLLDIVSPDKVLSAGDFALRAREVMDRLSQEGKRFLICGGSGLYIRAIFKPLAKIPKIDPKIREELQGKSLELLYQELEKVDPTAAQRIHPQDRQRIIRALEVFFQTKRPLSFFWSGKEGECPYQPFYIGLFLPKKILYRRIEERLARMMQEGFLEEVRRLLDLGYDENLYPFNAFGYKELMRYLKGKLTLEEALRIIKKKTKDYAKRQLTWFKRERIYWLDNSDPERTVKEIEELFPLGE
ncbi:MAG: tRNA (adenosine(37)-N6)-dimethylallyltransferase MiaA [candidate division WOR-3 bacterium]